MRENTLNISHSCKGPPNTGKMPLPDLFCDSCFRCEGMREDNCVRIFQAPFVIDKRFVSDTDFARCEGLDRNTCSLCCSWYVRVMMEVICGLQEECDSVFTPE
ncbi:hypothetical protein AMECASPLE_030337 [Ameca splendens]